MSTVITIIVSLVMFGVLITSHEFGHFIAAKKSGVEVLEFSAGMGPLILKKEKNGTQYSLRALPIGGFCRMKGEDEDDTEEGSLNAASPWKRIIILASGALMNFVVAILIFFIIFCINGTDATTTIASVTDNSPAMYAGVEKDDTVLAINGNDIEKWTDITSYIKEGDGSEVELLIGKKNNTTKTIIVTPEYNEESGAYLIGISPKTKTNIFTAIYKSFYMVGYYIVAIVDIFAGLFRGTVGMEAFSGPIGATVVIGQYIPLGIIYVLSIAASISISLGFFNLLPIPALDGSRILFTVIELIKGSPVNREAEGWIHTAGMVVLMIFALFVAYKDIITFF